MSYCNALSGMHQNKSVYLSMNKQATLATAAAAPKDMPAQSGNQGGHRVCLSDQSNIRPTFAVPAMGYAKHALPPSSSTGCVGVYTAAAR